MTKQTEITPVQTELIEDYQGQLTVKRGITTSMQFMDIKTYEAMKAAAAAIDPEAVGIATSATYKKFALGESVVGIFTQEDSITPSKVNEATGEITPQTVPSVQWMGQDGKLYQCAGVALYNQFFIDREPKFPFGTKIRITHTGESKNGAKTTKLYEVEVIPD